MNDLTTSPTLLHRLRQAPSDQDAWRELVRRYGPRIYQWCLRWRLRETDAEEVTQTVLVKLADKMCTFSYDSSRSFRAYLKTLTHYAWCDLLASRQRPDAASGGTGIHDLLDSVQARDDLVKHLEEEFDQELLTEAMLRVARRVEPRTWEAFRLTALEGLSGADTAAKLGMKVATVFVARSKVQKMLQAEVQRLEEGEKGDVS
jgi:RNA polymerase sigma-70 factor (ECF subfamily)